MVLVTATNGIVGANIAYQRIDIWYPIAFSDLKYKFHVHICLTILIIGIHIYNILAKIEMVFYFSARGIAV